LQLCFLPTFGCHSNAICSLKNSDSIFKFTNPDNPIVHAKKCLHIFYRSEICAIFKYFCLSLVIMATPLKIRIAYNLWITKILLFTGKFLEFLHKTKISAIFTDFCLNFVAIATPFDLLKILIAYLNPPTSKTLLFTQKISQYFIQNLNLCNFGLFCPKFGCNTLCSLKNSDSIFEFYDPKSLPYM